MKKILGIDIPDLTGLGPVELRALADQLKAAAKARFAASRADGATEADAITPAVAAEIREAKNFASQATEAAVAKEAEQAAFESEVADLEAEFADDAEDADDESDGEDEPEAAAESDNADDAEENEDEPETVTASWSPSARGVAARTKGGSEKAPPTPKRGNSYADAGFRATSAAGGMAQGDEFTSFKQLGEVLAEAGMSIAGSGGQRFAVAKLHGNFSEEQILRGDENDSAKLGGSDPFSPESQAVVAALCAPAEPTYDLATTSSLVRPFKGSLATYRPMRGQVSVYPTPKLGDIVDGRGIWTATDDANPTAEKEACATIDCANSEVYKIWGVYRCLTVKNMLAMTFPELVEAYLNRLGAATARLAETTLIDAAEGSANTVQVSASQVNDFGAAQNLLDTILLATSVYREEERYGDQQFDAWIPRWALVQLKRDVARMRRTSGSFRDRLPTTAEVNGVLADAGIDVTWTYESASTWPEVDYLDITDGEADLPELPQTTKFLFTPKGNLRALDRGDLSIGVAPGNIYRDNDSNTRNEFTIFQESFEGLLDLGAQNWVVGLDNFVPNGVQVADAEGTTVGS